MLLLAGTTSLAACGAGSTTTPAQSEAAQRINGYVLAVNKVGAPFTHPPTAGMLRTAIAELAVIAPPAQFRVSYERFLRGLHGELSAFEDVERGVRTHDENLISRAQATKQQQAGVALGALSEAQAVLAKCQNDNYTC
jgi:hypothetical protein